MLVEELGTDDEVTLEVDPVAQKVPAQPAKSTKSARKMHLPISGDNLVLAAMFIGGIVAVYVLKLSVKPEAASAKQREAEVKVEAAIAALAVPSAASLKADNAESVVNTLHNDTRDRQLPAWLVTRNPFVFKAPKPKDKSRFPVGDGARSPGRIGSVTAAEQARAKALADVRGLELQTILMAARPMAMISGRAVVKGQKISGWTVGVIEPMRVVMIWQARGKAPELRHVLTMEDRRPG